MPRVSTLVITRPDVDCKGLTVVIVVIFWFNLGFMKFASRNAINLDKQVDDRKDLYLGIVFFRVEVVSLSNRRDVKGLRDEERWASVPRPLYLRSECAGKKMLPCDRDQSELCPVQFSQ